MGHRIEHELERERRRECCCWPTGFFSAPIVSEVCARERSFAGPPFTFCRSLEWISVAGPPVAHSAVVSAFDPSCIRCSS